MTQIKKDRNVLIQEYFNELYSEAKKSEITQISFTKLYEKVGEAFYLSASRVRKIVKGYDV